MEKPQVSNIYGRIQYVDRFPDYTVQVVGASEDLAVQEVASFPNHPGQWQIVDSYPDYRIQISDASYDFKVRFVDSFPGPK